MIETSIIVLSIILAFMAGRAFPTYKLRTAIGEEAVRSAVEEKFVLDISGFPSRDWECIHIIEDHSGPFGQPNRKLVLEEGGEQIVVASVDKNVQIGTIVHLQLRPIVTYPICPVSFVDKYVFALAASDQPLQEE